MNPVTDGAEIERYRALVSEMTEDQTEFSPQWLRSAGWSVVPAESGGRLWPDDIPCLVSALSAAGYVRCLAVTTEDLGETPPCYILSIDEADFRELNRELGLFRFLLTDEDRSWAISCTEWYNLFAGPEKLVEAMVGMPIAKAREEFIRFVTPLAKGDPDYALLKIAHRYAM